MNALLLPALRRVVADGVLASLFSGLVLSRHGRTDHAHRVGLGEYRVGRPPLRSTATTIALHTATSVVWGALYDRLRALRKRPGRLDACTDALLLTAVAAGLDKVVHPLRLTPGADKRAEVGPSRTSLLMVYGGFAAGLALGGLWALRSHPSRQAPGYVDVDDDEDDHPVPAPRRFWDRA